MKWDELKAMHAGVSRDAVDPDEYAAALHNAFPALVEWVEAMREALQDLVDHQNGCPLPKYEEGWNRAMHLAALALADKPLTEDAK